MTAKAFKKEGFEAIAERIGALNYTKSEKRAIIKAINEAIDQKKSELKADDFSKKVLASLEKELAGYADVVGDAAAQKASDIVSGRIPIDLAADLTTIDNFGRLANDIDIHSRHVFSDVVLFHRYVVDGENDKAEDKLEDILNTEESTELEAIYNTLKENFGNRKEVKSLRKQMNAVVRLNKVFKKQYSVLDGRRTPDIWWELRDLANAYNEAQKRASETLQKHRSGLSDIDINITPPMIEDEIIDFYQSKIDELSINLTADVVESVYLSKTFGMTKEVLKNVDFEEMADKMAREAYHQIESKEGEEDFERAERALEAFKSIARGRANKKAAMLEAKDPMAKIAGVFTSSKPMTSEEARLAATRRNTYGYIGTGSVATSFKEARIKKEIAALKEERKKLKAEAEELRDTMPAKSTGRGPGNKATIKAIKTKIREKDAEYRELGEQILALQEEEVGV